MPLVFPDLDALRWDDLVDDARSRLPSLAPEWTDHNLHDPGITIIDLLAWLVEHDSYRLNRVPERHVRAFLALLGVEPAGPEPAVVPVFLATRLPNPTVLAEDTVLITGDGDAALPFRTMGDVVVAGVDIGAIHSSSNGVSTPIQLGRPDAAPVHVFGDDPGPGTESALTVEFDRKFPRGEWCSLWFAIDRPVASPDSLRHHHDAVLEWAVSDGEAWTVLGADEVDDQTRSLSRSGLVRLLTPPGVGVTAVRARLIDGRPDRATALVRVEINAVLVQQAVRRSHGDGPIRPRTDGLGGQRIQLPDREIVTSAIDVASRHGLETLSWTVESSLVGRAPAAVRARLDPRAGVLELGDGIRGAIPPPGGEVLAAYLSTTGERGGVAPDSVWHGIDGCLVDVAGNAEPTVSGSSGESVDDATRRASDVLFAHERLIELVSRHQAASLDQVERAEVVETTVPPRATTAFDYERIALATPGTDIERVRAWPDIDANQPCLHQPGVVSVLVVPSLPRSRPRPTPGLLSAVRRHLDRHRLIGTRVVVAGPQYVPLSISIDVVADADRDASAVRQRLDDNLRTYFDALRGGPAGRGWPFGRNVTVSEVLQLAVECDLVRHVARLEVATLDGRTCSSVAVPRTALVDLTHVEIGVSS